MCKKANVQKKKENKEKSVKDRGKKRKLEIGKKWGTCKKKTSKAKYAKEKKEKIVLSRTHFVTHILQFFF